ncbi:hypothetical protein ACFGVS_26320 [Mucilaginibacter sp. AW1-7]|jgi:hypothetical protein|uniref:hypothetical protein n=1 Tax=unclassified Mucilaginibacter TaxID=2617802 RepID=UPI0008B14FD6|nr:MULTISPECIES: hypothetical protein [unclassified Mucilaginibacter]WDF76517.1 hypothetical protein PQ469_21735 [Mucilaginibacter sp. KACC 22773]SEP45247.1 hypothetical protein SAMN05428947_1222 [Mucilaginibacter sp. OK283]
MKKIILFIAISAGVALTAEAQTRVVVRTPARRVVVAARPRVVVVPARPVVVVRPAVPVVARRVVVRRRVL